MAMMYDENDPKRRKQQGIANPATLPAGVTEVPINPAAGVAPAIAGPVTGTQATPVVGSQINSAGTQGVADAVGNAAFAARQRVTSSINPMSTDAELYRRMETRLDPSFGNKGSPQARRMAAAAIADQLNIAHQTDVAPIAPIANAALADQQANNQSAIAAQQANQQGVLQDRAAGNAAELEGLRQTAETGRNDASIAGSIDIAKIGKGPPASYQRAADGTVSLLEGGKATTVADAQGTPFKPGDDVSASDRYKAYNERAAAIQASLTATPEQKAQQLDALKGDPLFAPLFSGPAISAPAPAAGAAPAAAPAKPDLQTFLSTMKGKGSKLSDAELTAYYNQHYGAK